MRTDDSTHEASDTNVDAPVGSDRPAKTDEARATDDADGLDETTDAAAAAQSTDAAATDADGPTATLAVAAAPIATGKDATILPTTAPAVQVTTDATDAAIRMTITGAGEAAAAADADADAEAPAPVTTAQTATVAADVDVDVDVNVDAQLTAATARGAEDAVDGDVKAGPTRPTTSMPTTTSGPSPVQLAAASFTDDAAGDAAPIDAPTVKVAAPTAAVATDVATGDAPDATAQLVQAAAVDGDADIDPDVDAALVATKTAASTGAVSTAKTEQVDVVDADVPEAVQAGKLNQQQAPTVAAAAQHQAAVQAKVAEKAAAQEGGDTAAPAKLEPISAHASAAVGQSEQAPSGIRVREGLLGAHQQQRIDHIAAQLATRLRMSQAAGGTEVKLNLKPHELGEVSVKMNVREGVVAATVLVDKADTLRTMQANIDDLKRSLESQGLVVQEFSVDVRGDAGAGGANARAQAELNRSAARTGSGSSSTVAGAAAVTPGLSGDRVVEADEIHDGDVSVLA